MGRRAVGESKAGREESLSLRPHQLSGVVPERCLRTEEQSRAGESCSNRRGVAGRGRVAVSGVGGLGEWWGEMGGGLHSSLSIGPSKPRVCLSVKQAGNQGLT